MLEEKDTYTLRELIENLPISIAELARRSKVNEVTIARIRNGTPGMRSTINRLLAALSETYDKRLTMSNVQGILIRGEGQSEEQKA